MKRLILCIGMAAMAWPVPAAPPAAPQHIQATLDAVEKQLGAIQAQVDDLESLAEELGGEVKKNRYGGSTNPEVSGSYGLLARDVDGGHLLRKHGTAMVGKMDVSFLAHLNDGSQLSFGFGPVFSPAASPDWNVDDTDEIRRGNGTASRLGTLLGTLKLQWRKGRHSLLAGFQSFQTSVLTLSGRLSNRPILFDKNPYLTNITSKAYFENQFLTGVPKRAPEESEHYIMGVRTDLGGPFNSDLMLFVANAEGYYDNESVPHEYGSMLTFDQRERLGGKYKLIAFNRSNASSEMVDRNGDTANAFFGLTNNTAFSVMVEQKFGRLELTAEGAGAWYDDPLLHVNGSAARLETVLPIGASSVKLGAYSIAPGYMLIDPQGKYSNNGTNLLRYRQDPDKPGAIIQQTNVSDPTVPINNSNTWYAGGQIRVGNAFLNITLQNSVQQAPTDSRIWATHFLSGNNLNTSLWWVEFNNNYIGWLPNSALDTVNGRYGKPEMEREFFYNPRRDPPAVGFQNTTYPLNDYNQTYSLKNAGSGVGFQSATIPDTDSKLYYNNAYRMLEAGLWRQVAEGILIVDPVTGRALPPSIKSNSMLALDLRLNWADLLPLRRPLYWQVYGEANTVYDNSAFIPSLTAESNVLFTQTILDTTLVAGVTDNLSMLLYAGIENWLSDRTRFYIPSSGANRPQWTTLEYHDRSVGAGLDWNVIPSKLNFYTRIKYLVHHDSFADRNSFIARYLEMEMKSYF
jgi:hypothetical protein